MEKTMAKKRMTKKERMRQRRRRQRMMFGGGLLLVAVVFTVILLLLGSKGCGTSKAEGDEVEVVPSAEATEAPTAEPTPTPEPVPSVDISDINSRSGILVRLSDGGKTFRLADDRRSLADRYGWKKCKENLSSRPQKTRQPELCSDRSCDGRCTGYPAGRRCLVFWRTA